MRGQYLTKDMESEEEIEGKAYAHYQSGRRLIRDWWMRNTCAA